MNFFFLVENKMQRIPFGASRPSKVNIVIHTLSSRSQFIRRCRQEIQTTQPPHSWSHTTSPMETISASLQASNTCTTWHRFGYHHSHNIEFPSAIQSRGSLTYFNYIDLSKPLVLIPIFQMIYIVYQGKEKKRKEPLTLKG